MQQLKSDLPPVTDAGAPLADTTLVTMQVTYEAKKASSCDAVETQVEISVHQLIVPFGQTGRMTMAMTSAEFRQCEMLTVSQNGAPWFELKFVSPVSTMRLNGVSCGISFSGAGVSMTVFNQNQSGKTIVVDAKPRFADLHHHEWTRDPQIVLPPEK
jgi:hypothetical protein